jgi:glycosyltransferase involved in cell wall biosynthesis
VKHQSIPPLQIVVVVDHNPDLFARITKRFPDMTVVENHRSRGSSGAWNSGVLAATSEIVAFLDDDAVAEHDWLEQLTAAYDDPDVVGVGGTITPMWQNGRPRWFPEEFDWVVGCTYKGMPEGLTQVRNLIGCNMSLRREALNASGGFRERLGHVGGRPSGCDETDVCIRMLQRWPNKRLLHNPHAIVRHAVPPERATWRYFCWRCYLEGRSKAFISRIAGMQDGLASERAHAFETLPIGLGRGVADALFRQDVSGLGRAVAIVVGLAITVTGFVIGTVLLRLDKRAVSD